MDAADGIWLEGDSSLTIASLLDGARGGHHDFALFRFCLPLLLLASHMSIGTCWRSADLVADRSTFDHRSHISLRFTLCTGQ